MRARLYTLDKNGDTLSVRDYEWVEYAMNAATEEAGDPASQAEWGDTQIGYEYISRAGREHLDKTGEYPAKYWQINGIQENGEDEEVLDEHHFDAYTDHEWSETGE
jgi:hypothetical protein